MKKINRFLGILAITFGLFVLLGAGKVSAATAGLLYTGTFNGSTTLTNYDVTGDGKADTFALTVYGQKYAIRSYKVTVNGTGGLSVNTPCLDITVQIVRLKNGSVFTRIAANDENGDATVDQIYRYSGGKYVSVFDLTHLVKSRTITRSGYKSKFDGHLDFVEIKAVKGNKITVDAAVQPPATGITKFRFYLKPSGNKLVRTSKTASLRKVSGSNQCQPGKYVKALKKLTVYKSSTSSSKKFTVKKGEKFKAVSLYLSNGKCRLKIKTKSGKTGWINIFQQATYTQNGRKYYTPVGSGWGYGG